MSLAVASPDFAVNREHRDAHSFAYTLTEGDVGPTWVHITGVLHSSGAARLTLRSDTHAHSRPVALSSSIFVS
jgi:hypothetical protein